LGCRGDHVSTVMVTVLSPASQTGVNLRLTF
jgi:hypothetical protein